ncbi:MAG: hypothetical protein ACLTQI_01360 [Slackia sp.]
MDIDGMGEEIVARLVESERVRDVADYYSLTEYELATLETGRVNKEGEPIHLGCDHRRETHRVDRGVEGASACPRALRLGHSSCR